MYIVPSKYSKKNAWKCHTWKVKYWESLRVREIQLDLAENRINRRIFVDIYKCWKIRLCDMRLVRLIMHFLHVQIIVCKCKMVFNVQFLKYLCHFGLATWILKCIYFRDKKHKNEKLCQTRKFFFYLFVMLIWKICWQFEFCYLWQIKIVY